ncbi:unnamed protein product [Vicia faba]|uniref:Uncharacterized protein n=1 Tax=Vicia faba TaxID=3906 RepID=A0AAV0ZVK9_VICFA|nr:unnamed protein product [Vicia faba]
MLKAVKLCRFERYYDSSDPFDLFHFPLTSRFSHFPKKMSSCQKSHRRRLPQINTRQHISTSISLQFKPLNMDLALDFVNSSSINGIKDPESTNSTTLRTHSNWRSLMQSMLI